jgi:hypothetical protein
MEAERGKRVTIRYKCRLQDGRVYQVGDHDTLEFVVGLARIPSALEAGIMGMQPGEHRTIRVPAAEVNLFPFPRGSHFAAATTGPPGIAYDFEPGEGGDVSLSLPLVKHFREPLPAGADLYFEVGVLAVETQPAT